MIDQDQLEDRIITLVQTSLREDDPEITVSAADSMDTVVSWDSLRFMSVFMAINEEFSLDPDFDDAIHYTSIASLVEYVRAQTN